VAAYSGDVAPPELLKNSILELQRFRADGAGRIDNAPHGAGASSAVPLKIRAWNNRSAFRVAESACEIDDKAYQQNQANPTATDEGTTKVKTAAAEQEKQNNHE
jgi:hypothetical protein